nr:FxSxx-COOH system tetratricopeptide repeat protein [Streptomyces sp. SID5643]
MVASLAAVLGTVVWAVVRYGLEKADQTASVVGGTIAVLSLPISLYALRAPGRAEADVAGNSAPAAREWVPAVAANASLRPPVPTAPVRGRDGELALLDRLRSGGGMAVLCGAGGLGKTTLAAEAARRAQQAGAAVFWVQWQDDAGRLAEDLIRIGQALDLSEGRLDAARRGQAVLVDVVWEHLAAVPGWVVVIDNVDRPGRVGPTRDAVAVYRGWLRPEGAGLLIVTSRDTAASTWGPQARILDLEPLQEAAAAAVLRDAAPSAGSEEEAGALAARLGGLPLALDAAGRYLATATSRYRDFTAYREALDREFGDLLGAQHPQAASDPHIARTVVRHTWDLSLDQLHTDGHTLARPLLHLLALLEAAPIPRSLVTPALLAEATGQNVTVTALDEALAGLHRYGLLHIPGAAPNAPDGDGAPTGIGPLVLHPLVREVMATNLAGTDITSWRNALHAHLTRAVDGTVRARRAGWPTARLLAPHLLPFLNHIQDDTFVATRNTLNALSDTLYEAGATSEEHLLRQQVLDAEIRHLGADHPDTLVSRNKLGLALRRLGRHHEAATVHRETLTDRQRTLGPDHPHTLNSRNNLALALVDLGQYPEAAHLLRRTLAYYENILSPDHPDTLTARNNLALALDHLGRHQEAADLHRQTLNDSERTLGPDHPDTLASRNNLALALRRLGRHQEAADLHRRNLADRERTLGTDHPDTLNSRNNLARALDHLGQHQEAADLHRRNLSDCRRVFGFDHPHTLTSRTNFARALHHLGHHREAADLHRQALTDFERILGPDHPNTLAARSNLVAAETAAAQVRRLRWPRLRRRSGP